MIKLLLKFITMVFSSFFLAVSIAFSLQTGTNFEIAGKIFMSNSLVVLINYVLWKIIDSTASK